MDTSEPKCVVNAVSDERLPMSVSETAYMGKIRPWGKTRKSLGVIHYPQEADG